MHKLARYRVLQRLGSGAAGGVYLVEDRVLGGPPLALKRLEHAGDPALRSSFVREFAVLASLSLPGVAQVRDLGTIPERADGSSDDPPAGPFFTRDYVAGQPLDQWAQGRPLDQIVHTFVRVLFTVAKLHGRAVIHGDLKPANVIVDGEGRPHLIDFGLASRGSELLSGSGTPLFMAPELFAGASSSMSADVYALGATLWALVAGRPPFDGLGARVVAAKLRGELPRVPEGSASAERELLEAALWALATDPRARAPSADELAARLERATPIHAARSELTDAFIVPRPRGRAELLDALARGPGDGESEGGITVLHGPRGMGKSTLLRELKWRLQLEGARVLEVRCRDAALSALAQLDRQLAAFQPDDPASPGSDGADVRAGLARERVPEDGEGLRAESPRSTAAERKARIAALAAALSPLDQPPFVLLVDDLDREGTLFAEAARAAIHRGLGRPPRVIASAESLFAPGIAGFVDVDALALSPLSDAEVRALIAEALGPVDEATADVLCARAAGNPGVLIEALSWLWKRGDLTARDLGQLASGDIGDSLAEGRAGRLSERARELLTLLALARAALPEELLGALFSPDYPGARGELLQQFLARAEDGALFACEPTLSEWLRRRAQGPAVAQLAGRVLACAGGARLDAVAQVELALAAGDRARLRAAFSDALAALLARGAAPSALRLCEACLGRGLNERALWLTMSELYVELGDCARAADYAERVLAERVRTDPGEAELDPIEGARACIAGARAHIAGARLERAIELLSGVSEQASASLRVQAARELARVHLRRGDVEAARAAVERGLSAASPDELGRVELLAIDATLSSQAGDHARAEQRFEQGLSSARALGALREQAVVLGYRAMSFERRGALERARADFSEGLSVARRTGDLGLTATYANNLGNVSQRAGYLDGVEQHYTLAGRLSRRSGQATMALFADNNLADLHVQLGSFARARVLAEASLAEAERLGIDVAQAKALDVLAEIDALSGDAEAALARYEAAAARYARLGRKHELAESWLDAAEVLLDRGGVSDVSAASAKLAAARDLIERHAQDDLRARLRLLIARARAGNGDVDGALKELAELERALDVERDRELLWQVLAAEAALYVQRGASLIGGRKAREAAELIELLAARVPQEAREAFRADPRRRAALELARTSREHAAAGGTRAALEEAHEFGGRGGAASLASSPLFARLLELIKRLARERDLDRLLERITDAAVDLSGAERGFVLLVDAQGQLAPHTVRASGGAEVDPHVAFSRSIAEAVLIDGEPIVTVNARDDRRLNEFMSVHKLMLKSVACIPISGPVGVLGVLYLEHRLRAGRFHESDIDLLVAFADQAAIALENARLWSENERRQRELEEKAGELANAKAEIERVLEARTEELEQARRDLGRARAELAGQSARHGIVGQGGAMRRVFALIDRVADSPVPVVVEGESGTGKELVARAIHFGGARKKEPFVALNCAALPEHLLESELFGHVRGAFTGAERDKRGLFLQAHGGTIFLDEFADMPPRMQLDLLRVLQERCIRPVGAESDVALDVRVIAATNRPLKQLVASGRLREDLYYRMSVVEIRLPALRDRAEDIPLLCDHFLSRLAARNGGRARKLSRAALDRILLDPLPGNVRQLEHLLTSAAMLADGPLIELADLALEAVEPDAPAARAPSSAAPEAAQDASLPNDVLTFKTREKRRILDALEKYGWNRAKAAHALGIPRRTFYRRLSEFEIL